MEKVCPFLIRKNLDHATEILVFQHPLAGIQIIKGGIETDEPLFEAAIRELFEESGIIRSTAHCQSAGQRWVDVFLWHFVQIDCTGLDLPNDWQYQTLDDYGHIFSLFWMPIDEFLQLDTQKTHPKYIDAVQFILQNLK